MPPIWKSCSYSRMEGRVEFSDGLKNKTSSIHFIASVAAQTLSRTRAMWDYPAVYGPEVKNKEGLDEERNAWDEKWHPSFCMDSYMRKSVVRFLRLDLPVSTQRLEKISTWFIWLHIKYGFWVITLRWHEDYMTEYEGRWWQNKLQTRREVARLLTCLLKK